MMKVWKWAGRADILGGIIGVLLLAIVVMSIIRYGIKPVMMLMFGDG